MNQSDLFKTIRIMEIRKVMNDFKLFRFDNAEILYKAGQYLTFVHPGNEAEIRRSYSITSTPGLEEDLTVGVKRIANGFFSRLLIDHAEAGDELLTTGAGGLFILPPDAD